jgi:virginiamycin B lyase
MRHVFSNGGTMPHATRTSIPLAILLGILLAIVLWAPLPVRAQDSLPDGPGKDAVEAACTGCHEARRLTSSGYTAQDWRNVVAMMRNVGAPIPPEQVGPITDYLVAHFPPRSRPAAVDLEGNVQVSFHEWVVPTPGSRPHDPLATRDGAIWYTGHMANLLGRLDPATGRIQEFRTPTPNAGPHGLVADAQGDIWYTGNFSGLIGRLDPLTGKFTEYKLPDPKAQDPHTPLFDRNGILWFTVQGGNMIGRLDPRTGDIRLVSAPTPRALPYGMVFTSKGVPYFDEFGTNRLGSIDPATMHITEHVLPNRDARPRRIAITPDDIIWYTDYARGQLGRFDPATEAVTEFASPGGPDSQPYAIAVLKGAVWYVESGVSPNALVRFDLGTQKFQTWKIPAGGGVVRNMMTTRDGNLVMAESGVNRVALVEVK